VLLDGERLPANSISLAPDMSLLPSALVKRVEVVTGGASAAYGSDAVAGVVNVILDSSFKGFRADLEGGTSYRGDATQTKFSLAWGGDVAPGARIITSFEHFNRDGLSADTRDFATPSALVPNPNSAAGQLPLLLVGNAYDANQAFGGLILNGPLAGSQFLPSGATAPYIPASCTISQPYALCNSKTDLAASANSIALTSPQKRDVGFARLTLDSSPTVQLNFDALLARSETSITSIPFDSSVLGVNLPINVNENPFLPAAVRSAYQAAGITTIDLGRLSTDQGVFQDLMVEKEARVSIGFEAKLLAGWSLQGRSSYGIVDDDDRWLNDYNVSRLLNAVDAVLVNGVPTCRINSSQVTDPGCSPANVIGSGNLSSASKQYFLGTLRDPLKTSNFTASLDLRGEPLSTPAGKVSLATGVAFRRDTAEQSSSGDFVFTGYPAFSGHLSVAELYGDMVVPLLAGSTQSADLEAGARWSHYDSAGSKFPWKLGLNWSPLKGIRLRVSASEDIRAPNIAEVSMPAFLSSFETVINPTPNGIPVFNDLGIAPGRSVTVRDVEGGSSGLVPEVSRTLAEGVIFEPRFLPNTMLSIDHYRIEISSAIAELPASEIVSGCAAGSESNCSAISVSETSNVPLIKTPWINVASLTTSGVDAEFQSRASIGGGEASLRALINYMYEYHQVVPGIPYQDLVGDLTSGLPSLKADIGVTYAKSRVTGTLYATYIGAGSYDKSMASQIENNHVPHVWYVGGGVNWDVPSGRCSCSLYANVNNLFNQAPPSVGFGIYSSLSNGTLIGVPYDRIGRFFKVGIRIQI
jgi:outer membrane receptor protein involved in Fe transport